MFLLFLFFLKKKIYWITAFCFFENKSVPVTQSSLGMFQFKRFCKFVSNSKQSTQLLTLGGVGGGLDQPVRWFSMKACRNEGPRLGVTPPPLPWPATGCRASSSPRHSNGTPGWFSDLIGQRPPLTCKSSTAINNSGHFSQGIHTTSRMIAGTDKEQLAGICSN